MTGADPSVRVARGWRAVVADPRVRVTALAVYYLAILGGLLVLYGGANVTAPSFVYQGF